MSPERLERQQIWVYAAALGFALPALGSALEVLIYLVLGVLLYVTFLQAPFRELRRSFTHGRYMAVVLALNFLIVPLVVWVLARLAPQDHYLLCDAVPRITIQLTNICRAAPVTRSPPEGVSGPIGGGVCGIVQAGFREANLSATG